MSISNAKVLVVDDSEINRYLLVRQLQMIGVEQIFERDDGSSALAFLQQPEKLTVEAQAMFPPTVIFLDINMPTIDGFGFLDVFTELKQSAIYQQCRVVIYTSSGLAEDVVRAKKYKCVSHYLVKGQSTLEEIKIAVQGDAPGV